VVTSNWQDWSNGSSTPSQFKALLIWAGLVCVSIFQQNPVTRFSCFTRAGFTSTPLTNVQTGCSSLSEEGPPLSSVGAAHSNKPGLLLSGEFRMVLQALFSVYNGGAQTVENNKNLTHLFNARKAS
jgi:hypothetical protein